MRAVLVITRSFLPLVRAQARARRAEPRLVVIDHPLGGLNAEQFAGRVDAAYDGVVEELRRLEVLS